MNSKWLQIPKNDSTATTRLVCLPYAGGGAAAFRPWTGQLTSEISVCAVALPGREYRMGEELETDMTKLVDQLVGEVAKLTGKPYFLFGHSLGAWVAFELAHRLQDMGAHTPKKLLVSACRAPSSPPVAPCHELPDKEFIEHLKKYGGLPEAVLAAPELLALVTPILKADVAMFDNYRYQERAPLSCPIVGYAGKNDAEAGPEAMAAWSKETKRTFSSRSYGGGHFFTQTHLDKFLGDLECDILDL